LYSGIGDARFPTSASLIWLKLPLQQGHDQPDKKAPYLSSVASSHVSDLLGNMRNVRLRETPLPQQLGVVLRPFEEIAFVELLNGHIKIVKPLLLAFS